MFETEMPAGQAASHSYVFVQPPKPSLSICATILSTRWLRSGRPWGRKAICVTLAPTNSIAEAFLQAATQAPQPMHVAESNARSAATGSSPLELNSQEFSGRWGRHPTARGSGARQRPDNSSYRFSGLSFA